VARALRPGGIYLVGSHLARYGEDPPEEDVWEVWRGGARRMASGAVREVRKHYAVILHGNAHVEPIRDELRRVASPAAILDHLERFLELYAPADLSAVSRRRWA
jgi:hypothetical protein